MTDNEVQCTGQTALNFILLALIRGTTPLMMHFAVIHLGSAGLTVAIKCGITLVMFTLSLLWFISIEPELRQAVRSNLKDKSTYWRLAIVGLLQSAIPYILALYSLQFLPPAMIGVFIVTTPWWAIIMERLPFIKIRHKIPGMIKTGMVLGVIGIVMILGPIIKESAQCAPHFKKNATLMINTTVIPETDSSSGCISPLNLFKATITLFLTPVLWGSAAVFWKIYRKDTHYFVSGVGQNVVGGVVGALVWLFANEANSLGEPSWKNTSGLVAVLFLGLATGWLATLLVQHLFHLLGARTTNQVLTSIPFIAFVEDCIFVRGVVIRHPWVIALEIIGILLVTGGVFISNLPETIYSRRVSRECRRSSLSQGLLAENSEGVQAGLNQVLNNEVHQYQPPPMMESDDTEHEDEEEEEVMTRANTSNLKSNYPKLTQVT